MKNEGSGKNRKKLQEKGYYIVLFLCVLAVGISGYIFVSTAVRRSAEQDTALSVPLIPEQLPEETKQTAASAEGQTPQKEAETPKEAEKPVSSLAIWPTKGEIVREFSDDALSYNATTRDWRLHDAVDLSCPEQTVMACMPGTVTQVYDDAFWGTTVAIRHDGGYESRYSNLTVMPTVEVGDSVEVGQIIGAVGETALLEAAEESHLHFQICKDGKPVNPADLIEKN